MRSVFLTVVFFASSVAAQVPNIGPASQPSQPSRVPVEQAESLYSRVYREVSLQDDANLIVVLNADFECPYCDKQAKAASLIAWPANTRYVSLPISGSDWLKFKARFKPSAYPLTIIFKRRGGAWSGKPVELYGFDDSTFTNAGKEISDAR